MDIVICTTPIRPIPTSYPPFGSMAVIQALRKAGFDPYFYDIDAFRPAFTEVERFFAERRPSVVGISAVVSTAYAYAKRLALAIKRASPRTRIVLGGNLAASAEILHRFAGVDVCVIGEGEVVSANLMRVLQACDGKPLDRAALSEVRGISFLDELGAFVFTGFELPLPREEVFDPDFSILETHSRPEVFFTDPFSRPDFSADPRAHEPRRAGKKLATLVTAKGCVARCTFCHRWDKGYRTVPVSQIVTKIRELQERHNVGFISFGDENFGSDRRQTEELIAALKPLDILWEVGGVRVRSVDPGLLARMKAAGCVAVYYGVETGSPTILDIMEKKATVQNNLDAARWTREAGLHTIFQIVLAMPGESPETVLETTQFLKTVTEHAADSPRSLMSINYIQALPGTPVYEYARHRGLIGRSLAEEELYLLSISDIDAADDTKFLNFTAYDTLTVRSWRRKIVLEVMRHYYDRKGVRPPSFASFVRASLTGRPPAGRSPATAAEGVIAAYNQGGYFNIQRDLGYDAIVAYFWPLRHAILFAWLLREEWRRLPPALFLRHVAGWLGGLLRGPDLSLAPGNVSLRAHMAQAVVRPLSPTESAMEPLRLGR